jgi:glycosyltransferase involved in cell wall biosynthesis
MGNILVGNMRICLICVEIFAWGKYGGFGMATRTLGRELTKRGIEVFAIVPRRKGQKPVEELDGITVLSHPYYFPFAAIDLVKRCGADIYHSQEPSFGTYLAIKAMPDRKHVITIRDPRKLHDWKKEFQLPSRNRLQVLLSYLYEDNFFVSMAVRRADRVFCASDHLIPKVKSKYISRQSFDFLPTPIFIPNNVRKSVSPTICSVGRLDRRKRPEIFFELAKRFPHIRFISVGESRDGEWDSFLRREYSSLPNLEMVGFIDQFSSKEHSKILDKSWIVINSATREGLPLSFLEAAAHKCAILSSVDPGGFVSKFGYYAEDGDFVKGLNVLLADQMWKERGELAYKFVEESFELNRAIDRHIQVYEKLIGNHQETNT